MELPKNKKKCFALWQSFGLPSEASLVRKSILFLAGRGAKRCCSHLFVGGPIWFLDWIQDCCPKRLCQCGQISRAFWSGIPITFYRQSRLWMRDYFQKNWTSCAINQCPHYWNHPFLIGHGDGLGPGDKATSMKKVFTNPFRSGSFAGCILRLGVHWVISIQKE